MTGIAILNYNDITNTCACVESVYRHCPAGSFRMCVVDNASRPEVRDAVGKLLTDKYPETEYILSGENLGYARGNDLAFRFFDDQPEISEILVLNNDVILTQDILTPLTEWLRKEADCAVVSPLLYSKSGDIDYACARSVKTTKELLIRSTSLSRTAWGRKIIDRSFILKQQPEMADSKVPVPISLPSGSCMLLKKDAFSRAGYLDGSTFLYFEEDILWAKLSALGYTSYLMPYVSAVHLGAGTTSKSPSSFVYKAFRNSLLYFMKNFSDSSRAAITYVSVRTAAALWWKQLKEKIR